MHTTACQDTTAQAQTKQKTSHAEHTKHNSQLLWCWQQMKAQNKLQWTFLVLCKGWEVQGWGKGCVWGLEFGRENQQQVVVSTECCLHFGLNLPFRGLLDGFLWSHEKPLLLKGAVDNNGVHRDESSRVCCCKHFTKYFTARAWAKGANVFLSWQEGALFWLSCIPSPLPQRVVWA